MNFAENQDSQQRLLGVTTGTNTEGGSIDESGCYTAEVTPDAVLDFFDEIRGSVLTAGDVVDAFNCSSEPPAETSESERRMTGLTPASRDGVSSGGEPVTNGSAEAYPAAYRRKRMGNQRLKPIAAIEDPPDPPEGFGSWSGYTDPGGRWLPKAAKVGAFTAITVVSGFLFAFALGAVPGLDMISFGAVTQAMMLIAGPALLVLLGGQLSGRIRSMIDEANTLCTHSIVA